MRVDLVGRGVEALETGAPGEHVVLPALMRGLAPVELGHDLAREELEAGADVLVWRAAGLVEEDDLVHVGGLELAQPSSDRVGGPDQARA